MVETPEHDMAGPGRAEPSRQVGDVDQVKVFSDSDAAEGGLRKTIPKAWPSNTRFSSGRCPVRFRREGERKAVSERDSCGAFRTRAPALSPRLGPF